MVAETKVLCPSETIEVLEVPYPFETEAPTTIEVTLQTDTETPATNDIKVNLSIKIKVIALASNELSVRTNGRFSRGPNDCFVLIGYSDHVSFRLWKGEICI